jgi:hypothetical protein
VEVNNVLKYFFIEQLCLQNVVKKQRNYNTWKYENEKKKNQIYLTTVCLKLTRAVRSASTGRLERHH